MNTIECVKDAFEVQNYIIGTLSGGVDGPRILESVEETDGQIAVKWHNPKICGLSDCVYHNIDISTHTDTYEFVGNKIKMNGSDKIFTEDPWVNEEIENFFSKWGLKSQLKNPEIYVYDSRDDGKTSDDDFIFI